MTTCLPAACFAGLLLLLGLLVCGALLYEFRDSDRAARSRRRRRVRWGRA